MNERLDSFENKLVSSLVTIDKFRSAYNHEPRDYHECARIIKSDSVLLTRFTALANTPEYRPRNYTDRIRWIIQAMKPKLVNYEIYNMIRNIPYFRNLKRLGFNFLKYQISSVLISLTMFLMYQDFDEVKRKVFSDFKDLSKKAYSIQNFIYDLYLLGMIHNIGKLIIAEVFPEIYEAMRKRLQNTISSSEMILQLEEALFKEISPDQGERINHCWFGREILKKLKYHEVFQTAVIEHHDKVESSNNLSRYLYLCSSLYSREVNADYEGNGEFTTKINREVFEDFSKEYGIAESDFRRTIVKIEEQVNTHINYYESNFSNMGNGRFKIIDERYTDKIFRELHNDLYALLGKYEETEQVIVMDNLIRYFRHKLKDQYVPAHYFAIDVVGSSKLGSSENEIVTQDAFKEFHSLVKEELSTFPGNVYNVIHVEGDSYIIQFANIEDAVSLQKSISESRQVLSQRTGMSFNFYYYLHSGDEIKYSALEGGEKKSPVIDELGHLMKDLKEVNRFLICEKTVFLLPESQRGKFTRYRSSRDGFMTYIDQVG